MKVLSTFLAAALLAAPPCRAIPNSVIGPITQANSPLNGRDLTEQALAALRGGDTLPGEWVDDGSIGGSEISHLLARPEMFGREVRMLRATRRDGRLVQLEATYVDAGSYFGYFSESLADGLGRRQREEEIARLMEERQAAFAERYRTELDGLRAELSSLGDRPNPKSRRFGKVRLLRTEPEEWRMGDLVVRLFAADNRLVRVTVSPEGETPDGWIDASLADESERERLARLKTSVRAEGGGVHIDGIRTVPQGYRPYCGLNTLAMTARHFGMTLDEDWMAAAAGFRNTGSAQGSNMVKLYHAVASEAGLSLDRSNRFELASVRASLEEGLPVIVWRRFSHERNRLHDRLSRNPDASPPDPAGVEEREGWPGEDAPLHASVITGYDPVKSEIFFLESWSGHDHTRRMRVEEMAATTYLCFAFKP